MSDLIRLDLGHNEITEIPDEISQLTSLEQLWCNSNPLNKLSAELYKCSKLKVIDVRDTEINDIPREVGRLKNLVEFDLRGNKLRSKLDVKADNVTSVMAHLAHKDTRKQLKIRLENSLREGIYREVADGEEATIRIKRLVKEVFTAFKDNAEVKNVIRNCDRLFPEDLRVANAVDIRKIFITLRRENEMKKLAAELELKLRNIYFDRIDPQKVEGIVHGIYGEIRDLDDIKFLIKHAKVLFPDNSEDVVPGVLRDDLVQLQNKLAQERQAAIDSLERALKAYYPDTEPVNVKRATDETSEFFKKSEEIKNLAADVNVHFPEDFLDVVPKEVRKSFLKAKRGDVDE